jgi:hypothetical protein
MKGRARARRPRDEQKKRGGTGKAEVARAGIQARIAADSGARPAAEVYLPWCRGSGRCGTWSWVLAITPVGLTCGTCDGPGIGTGAGGSGSRGVGLGVLTLLTDAHYLSRSVQLDHHRGGDQPDGEDDESAAERVLLGAQAASVVGECSAEVDE